MRLRGIQPNPYAQLDALRSEQRAAARREAAQVRKELIESASELAGESDFSDLRITQAEQQEESRKHAQRRGKQNAPARQRPTEEAPTDSEDAGPHISDWA